MDTGLGGYPNTIFLKKEPVLRKKSGGERRREVKGIR
jgi:hypothetical protein